MTIEKLVLTDLHDNDHRITFVVPEHRGKGYYSSELNSFGRKLCLAIAGIALAAFAFSAHAEEAINNKWAVYQKAQKTECRKDLFQSPTPKVEDKRPYDAPYKERVKDNRFKPHFVYYQEKNTWLNVSAVPAFETVNRELYLYYPSTQKVFIVHFRNTDECNAAVRILLEGFNMELPPYYVTEYGN